MSYCICVAPKYGNFLSDTFDSALLLTFTWTSFSLSLMSPPPQFWFNFQKFLPPCKTWFIRKIWQVSFKSTEELLQPLMFFLPLNSYISQLLKYANLLPVSAAVVKSTCYSASAYLLIILWFSCSQVHHMLLLLHLPHTHRPTLYRSWGWG